MWRAGMTDATLDMKVVCAWCGAVIRHAPDGSPVSHGMCGRCFQKAMASDHPRAVFLARDDCEIYALTNAMDAWRALRALRDSIRPYRDHCPDHVVTEEAGRLWDAVDAVLRGHGLDVDLALGAD